MRYEKELIARIEEARRRRDALRADLSNLQSRIKYHSSCGRTTTVKALKKEMERIRREYRKAKEMVNELVQEWQKLRKERRYLL